MFLTNSIRFPIDFRYLASVNNISVFVIGLFGKYGKPDIAGAAALGINPGCAAVQINENRYAHDFSS